MVPLLERPLESTYYSLDTEYVYITRQNNIEMNCSVRNWVFLVLEIYFQCYVMHLQYHLLTQLVNVT